MTRVTAYKLFLGDQSTTAPYHYRRGYTIHTITAAVFPSGGTFNFGALGYHTVYGCVGFTQYDVLDGDVLFDGDSNYLQIKTRKRWPEFGTFQFYEIELEKLTHFPFLAGFFGFEDTEHGEIGYEFEDGFERGTWAL